MKTLVFKCPLALALLLLVTLQAGVGAQLTITVTTPNAPSGDGTPNTFIGTGNQIASSLLGSGTPAFLWGVVSSGDVNAVCTQIVNTGSLSFGATLDAAGGTQSLTMQVSSTHFTTGAHNACTAGFPDQTFIQLLATKGVDGVENLES